MDIKNKNILITGAHGFLGRHFLDELRSNGYKNIFAPPSISLDLRSYKDVEDYVIMHSIDIIVHLAADVGGIGYNQDHPASLFENNMMMGLNVLNLAKLNQIEKILMLGTICSYPKVTRVPFLEKDLWNGFPEETNAPYGVAKKALLTYAQAVRQEYDANIIYLMPTNLVGEYDHFHIRNSHIVPALIQKFHKAVVSHSDIVVLWGDGTPTREFLYAGDCAKGMRLALENYNGADPINLGTGQEISIQRLADKIARKMGFFGTIEWDITKPNGQPRRCLNIYKAKRLFDFEAQTDLDEAIDLTIQWFKNSR